MQAFFFATFLVPLVARDFRKTEFWKNFALSFGAANLSFTHLN